MISTEKLFKLQKSFLWQCVVFLVELLYKLCGHEKLVDVTLCGRPLRLYCQDFSRISRRSHWHHCGRGSVRDGDVKNGWLYAVGTEPWIPRLICSIFNCQTKKNNWDKTIIWIKPSQVSCLFSCLFTCWFFLVSLKLHFLAVPQDCFLKTVGRHKNT